VGEEVVGYYRTTCRKCGGPIVVVRAGQAVIDVAAARIAVNVRIEDKRPKAGVDI
jgi:hypothetical protein